jgi:predicted DNA-binding protein with PD1-like motif
VKPQRLRYGYVLRLDPGEEILASLTDFARHEGVRAGLISGLGAASDLELGFFVRGEDRYVRETLAGEHEILALTGNLSAIAGEPFVHCHILVAGEDLAARGGHLFRAVVTVTCEVQIVTDPGTIERVRVPGKTFMPLEPQG